ncbi:hypothetical protein RFI_10179 [Reticulomyxa filosa]|uniref:Cyclic nucleotide-binding domain-containing protein n=1 Tax=Reticulomyxa filosa TaxID=46433 RepID=X6NM20_RETFI|nr:hypothetical protein RFI_10179 [Reticulomyxa filosa]|eukprot:ETO26953.1 hypothetical protein RFI_10179 [Reticulomyxa filosa]
MKDQKPFYAVDIEQLLCFYTFLLKFVRFQFWIHHLHRKKLIKHFSPLNCSNKLVYFLIKKMGLCLSLNDIKKKNSAPPNTTSNPPVVPVPSSQEANTDPIAVPGEYQEKISKNYIIPAEYQEEAITEEEQNGTEKCKNSVISETSTSKSTTEEEKKAIELWDSLKPNVEIGEWLRNFPIFGRLPKEKREKIGGAMHVQIYAPNAVVFEQGEIGDQFYLIKSGCACVTVDKRDSNGEVTNKEVACLHRGDYC